MKEIKTYIINLKSSVDRKKRITENLKGLSFLDYSFIEAVDGRSMTHDEIDHSFDISSFYKIYKREPLRGEIGCTLSHRKCYKNLVEQKDLDYCLILEDDAFFYNDFEDKIFDIVEELKNCDYPKIILLSPSFSFFCKKNKSSYTLCDIFQGCMTIGYLINRKAAELLLSKDLFPYYLADDWRLIKRKGIILQGVVPYLVCWNDSQNKSTIKDSSSQIKSRVSFLKKLKVLTDFVFVVDRFLGLIGHKYDYTKY